MHAAYHIVHKFLLTSDLWPTLPRQLSSSPLCAYHLPLPFPASSAHSSPLIYTTSLPAAHNPSQSSHLTAQVIAIKHHSTLKPSPGQNVQLQRRVRRLTMKPGLFNPNRIVWSLNLYDWRCLTRGRRTWKWQIFGFSGTCMQCVVGLTLPSSEVGSQWPSPYVLLSVLSDVVGVRLRILKHSQGNSCCNRSWSWFHPI
jgi:hypothetical protein